MNLTAEQRAALSAIGKLGGKSGKGAVKRRPKEHYIEMGRLGGLARAKNAEAAKGTRP